MRLTEYARENGVDNLSDLVRDGLKPILGDRGPNLKQSIAQLSHRLERLEKTLAALVDQSPNGKVVDDLPVFPTD